MNAYFNEVYLKGKISQPVPSAFDKNIYLSTLEIKRFSSKADLIPIQIPKEYFSSFSENDFVEIYGSFRSLHNGKNLNLFVFPKKITLLKHEQYINHIELTGYIRNKKPLRKTPLTNKSIIDFFIETRDFMKSCYIPIIAWNECAHMIADLNNNKIISISGRIESRKYIKKHADGSEEEKTAYEVSMVYLN